jgi:hypothetical protein
VGPAIATWFGGGSNQMASQARLTSVKVNNINPAGRYNDTVTHGYTTLTAGGTAGNQLPALLTLCWTFETGKTGGRARRGRVYPPSGMGALGSGVTVAGTETAKALTAAKSLLTILLINEPGGSTSHYLVRPMVFSRVDGSFNIINRVSCDNVIDVQRRRKKRVGGVRTGSNWP